MSLMDFCITEVSYKETYMVFYFWENEQTQFNIGGTVCIQFYKYKEIYGREMHQIVNNDFLRGRK